MTPSPTTYHQTIAMRLVHRMVGHATAKERYRIVCPGGRVPGETETYQPDIIFIARERLRIMEPERINGALD